MTTFRGCFFFLYTLTLDEDIKLYFMEFVFNDVMESTYRVDLAIVGKNSVELKAIQTKLNQWSTTKLLVKYKITDVGDSLLFEIIRIKGDD